MSEVVEQQDEAQEAARQAEARYCAVLVGSRDRHAVRLWWQRLTLGPGEAKRRGLPPPRPRGVRAILRRCETADAAVLTEGFRQLWQALPTPDDDPGRRDRRHDIEAWACAALVAAELQVETAGATPGKAFASQRKDTDRPCMSELRFQQLQQSQSSAELVRRMRRAIALVGHKNISVVNLVDDVLLWCRERDTNGPGVARRVENRIAFRWANDYFTTLARYQND